LILGGKLFVVVVGGVFCQNQKALGFDELLFGVSFLRLWVVVLGKTFLVAFIHVFQGSFCEGKNKLGVF
jgi:hypothetical protein